MAHAYDRRYQAERAALLATSPLCSFVDDGGVKCQERADSADHSPPLAFHDHLAGTGCCVLRPACRDHQNRQGAAIANGTLRRLPTPSRAW